MPRSLNDIILRSIWYIFGYPLVRGFLIAARLASLLPRLSLEPLKALAPSYLTGYGSLAIFKRLPPEILEEIFVHTCGDEYIGFFQHFSLPHKDDCKPNSYYAISRMNTVYLLKAVCKEWKELVERTPRLWQRVYFNFDDFWIETGVFRNVRHFEDMTKYVLLRRSAGLGLHVKISGQALYERERLDIRSRMRYFVPLLDILAKEGYRWSSAVFWDLDSSGNGGSNAVMHATLQSTIAHSSFPRLRSLIYDTRAARHHDYNSPRLDFSSSAPALKELVLRAGDFEMLNTSSPIIKCRWGSLATLVIDCQGTAQPTSTLLHLSTVLEAVRNSLVSLHWRGSTSLAVLPGQGISPRIVEFRCLRSLVVEDTAFVVCDVLLPSISSPALQTLHILLCKGYVSASNWQWERSIPRSISNLGKFLLLAPLLQTFSIVHSPGLEIYVLHQEKDPKGKKRLEYGHLFLRGSPGDVRRRVQPLTEWTGPTNEPVPSLAAIRFNLMESHLVAKSFSLVPLAAYCLKPAKGRGAEPARLLPPRPMTIWEQSVWSERVYGEKERVVRLLDFVQSFDHGSSLSGARSPELVSGILRKMDEVSILVLVHVLELLGSSTVQDLLPDSCRITYSIAI